MKYLYSLSAAILLTSPVGAHVSTHSAPQHSIEHMIIGVVLIAAAAIGYRYIRKAKKT